MQGYGSDQEGGHGQFSGSGDSMMTSESFVGWRQESRFESSAIVPGFRLPEEPYFTSPRMGCPMAEN